MASIDKVQPCPACGENILFDMLDMHLDFECLANEEDDQDEDIVQTIRSHLNKDVIIWSSDPKSLPPTLGYQPDDVPGSLFFVKTPKKSDVSKGWEEDLDKAAKVIDDATAILIVAGAGIGVDSGLPDYRGPSGFWKAYPALEKLGLSIDDISHPDWFSKDPTFAWGFYGHRLDLYKNANPHNGFQALKQMVEAKKGNYFIFTSNIDGQFQKAGFDDDRIYECHGSLGYLQCMKGCGHNEVWALHNEGVIPDVDMKTMKAKKSTMPKCPKCKGIARPNVSMFGDTSASWNNTRSEKQRHKLLNWLKEAFPYSHQGKFDLASEPPTNSLSFPHDPTSTSSSSSSSSSSTTVSTTTYKRKTKKKATTTTENTNGNVNNSNVEYEENVDIVQQQIHIEKKEDTITEETDTTITQTRKKRRTTRHNNEEKTSKKKEKEEKETLFKPKFEPVVTRKRGKLMDLERQGKRLVIIECGCGVSLHSIRIESEALLRNAHEIDKGERVRLVRLNPHDWQVPPGHNVGLGLGAKAGLISILQRLECINRDKE